MEIKFFPSQQNFVEFCITFNAEACGGLVCVLVCLAFNLPSRRLYSTLCPLALPLSSPHFVAAFAQSFFVAISVS